MSRPISDLDVPTGDLERQIRDLVARQNDQRAETSAKRLRAVLAPTDTAPEEAS